jgi:hypothetical protein
VLVTAHTEKGNAGPTYKRGLGSRRCARTSTTASTAPGRPGPGPGPGSAQGVAVESAVHSACLDAALAQLPQTERAQVLVRTDAGGCSKASPAPHHRPGVEYSVGFPVRGLSKRRSTPSPSPHSSTASTPTDCPRRRPGGPTDPVDAAPTKPTCSRPGSDPALPEAMPVIARRERPHRRVAAADQPQRPADGRLCHQHPRLGRLPTRRSDTDNAPSPRTPGCGTCPRLRTEPDLPRDRRPGHGPAAHLDHPGLGRTRRWGKDSDFGSWPSPDASAAPAAADACAYPESGATTSSAPAGRRYSPPGHHPCSAQRGVHLWLNHNSAPRIRLVRTWVWTDSKFSGQPAGRVHRRLDLARFVDWFAGVDPSARDAEPSARLITGARRTSPARSPTASTSDRRPGRRLDTSSPAGPLGT